MTMAKVESRVHKLLRRNSVAFLIAASMTSILLVTVGSLLDSSHAIASKVLIVLGSSGLGTCFGLVFGGVFGASALQRVKELIEDSLSSSLAAPDHQLEEFRKTWHHYLLTKIGEHLVWRYRKLDFSRTSVPGKLVTAFNVQGPDGGLHTYNIEGYLAEPRLVFVETPSGGSEPPIVQIYPRATERFRRRHAGIALLQSWDGDNLMVPVLLCASPLTFDNVKIQEGTLPEKTYASLNETWHKDASVAGLVFVDKADGVGKGHESI